MADSSLNSKHKLLNAADPANIEKAARCLKQGGIVAFPTETVYGLGADAFNVSAVCRVFETKRRPSFDPLIVHVADKREVSRLWKETPALAGRLVAAFWPGPLTIVLPKRDEVPDVVTAGLPTVAVRMPDHAAALNLVRALGNPIAAPSANLFGYTSPTSAEAVLEDLGDRVDFVLDGGATAVGVESTVIKIQKDGAVLLRPGGVTLESLQKFTNVARPEIPRQAPYESPGQLSAHYAPRTPFLLLDKAFREAMRELEGIHKTFMDSKIRWPRLGLLAFGSKTGQPLFQNMEILSAQCDLTEAASNLFKAMRKLDKMNLDLILAEPVPETGIGLAILDRLEKAAAGQRNLTTYFEGKIHGA